jgi:hypothetical protein
MPGKRNRTATILLRKRFDVLVTVTEDFLEKPIVPIRGTFIGLFVIVHPHTKQEVFDSLLTFSLIDFHTILS